MPILGPSFVDAVMFGPADRDWLRAIEAKIEAALVEVGGVKARLGIVETKLFTHDNLANERHRDQKQFEEESRNDRQRLREEMWKSNDSLLWKLIGAMATLLVMSGGALLTVMHWLPTK
jgi:hypothetical protein